MHDKKIVDTEPIGYPPDTVLYKDTGFQGYEPQVRQTHQPKKSPVKARYPGDKSVTIASCHESAFV